jgi:RNA polymerase sigma-70 factor, ECF subfamily
VSREAIAGREPTLAIAALGRATLNEQAFADFHARTSRPLWNYIRRVCGDPSLADDIVQEAYFRFLRSARPDATEPERVSFLYKTATNLAYDHWRRRQREARSLLTLPRPSPPAMATVDPDLSRVFETLTPRDRALMWLAHVEGWTHKEIGAALGLRATSVRVLLFRARAILARRITRAGLRSVKESR